jgi:hypothetical protein
MACGRLRQESNFFRAAIYFRERKNMKALFGAEERGQCLYYFGLKRGSRPLRAAYGINKNNPTIFSLF